MSTVLSILPSLHFTLSLFSQSNERSLRNGRGSSIYVHNQFNVLSDRTKNRPCSRDLSQESEGTGAKKMATFPLFSRKIPALSPISLISNLSLLLYHPLLFPRSLSALILHESANMSGLIIAEGVWKERRAADEKDRREIVRIEEGQFARNLVGLLQISNGISIPSLPFARSLADRLTVSAPCQIR